MSDGPALSAAAAAAAVLDATAWGATTVLVAGAGAGGRAGSGVPRMVVTPGGAPAGTLGSPELDRRAIALAEAVAAGDREEGLHAVPDVDGGVELYLELHHPVPELVIVGAGHVAQPLSAVGALLGFRVTVLDDRPDFATSRRFPDADRTARMDLDAPFAGVAVGPLTHVVLLTRGPEHDHACLRRLLVADPLPRYVGMIGSRPRIRATWERLLREGIPRDRVAAVRAPVGLDLAARTPAEIAVAVAAEIVMAWRGGSGRPLRDVATVLERFFPAGDRSPPDSVPSTPDPGQA